MLAFLGTARRACRCNGNWGRCKQYLAEDPPGTHPQQHVSTQRSDMLLLHIADPLMNCVADSMNWCVCYTTQYTQLISFLESTRSFTVDGKQFRIWAELLPPSNFRAQPGGECEAPPDDPRTDFNETALINQSFTAWSKGAEVRFAYWFAQHVQHPIVEKHRFLTSNCVVSVAGTTLDGVPCLVC